jgi:hypothetical protein
MDANLYIGPADHVPRNEHAAIEVIFHFLNQTGRRIGAMREVLSDRGALLAAFETFDEPRDCSGRSEFRLLIFGTYDGEPLIDSEDDDLPAGPCGKTVNEVKRRFYSLCARRDQQCHSRELNDTQLVYEKRFWPILEG